MISPAVRIASALLSCMLLAACGSTPDPRPPYATAEPPPPPPELSPEPAGSEPGVPASPAPGRPRKAGTDGEPGLTANAPPQPAGQRTGWRLVFSDEFDGTRLDPERWHDHSTAEPDRGHGNLGNEQLEWNQAANCSVAGGQLTMTAKRQGVVSPSGTRYQWTSCLITTTPSYSFTHGYIEERAILPSARGFWPAFWTWQTHDVRKHTETDVYEFYSDNHTKMYSTQYSGKQGRCSWRLPFDPTTGWHTYGVAIMPTGTTWYADGRRVCHTPATSDAPTSIISNLAVYSKIPPLPTTSSATKRVDYIRAWRAS